MIYFQLTFLPTINTFTSADQDNVKASPPTSKRLTQVLDRTSQKRTVPSVEQLANSDSRTGLKSTFSTPAEWPRRSVEYLTAGRSGFQIRRVRSADPVAMSCPVGFHARVRILSCQGILDQQWLHEKNGMVRPEEKHTCEILVPLTRGRNKTAS